MLQYHYIVIFQLLYVYSSSKLCKSRSESMNLTFGYDVCISFIKMIYLCIEKSINSSKMHYLYMFVENHSYYKSE